MIKYMSHLENASIALGDVWASSRCNARDS